MEGREKSTDERMTQSRPHAMLGRGGGHLLRTFWAGGAGERSVSRTPPKRPLWAGLGGLSVAAGVEADFIETSFSVGAEALCPQTPVSPAGGRDKQIKLDPNSLDRTTGTPGGGAMWPQGGKRAPFSMLKVSSHRRESDICDES